LLTLGDPLCSGMAADTGPRWRADWCWTNEPGWDPMTGLPESCRCPVALLAEAADEERCICAPCASAADAGIGAEPNPSPARPGCGWLPEATAFGATTRGGMGCGAEPRPAGGTRNG
jgi:hypothetical protein